MTYSGSYTRRTAPNTNKQAQRKASDLEKSRKQWVSDAQQNNQDWKVEQARLNNLQKMEDFAIANQQVETAKAFNKLVQEGAVPFTKMKWDEAIAKGRKDAKENNQEWKARVEENETLNRKVEETTKAQTKVIKKLTLDEHKNFLQNKGHFYRMGYERQLLDEYVAGFGNHRIEQLTNSNTLIRGTDVGIKDWKKLGKDGYEAASGQIYNDYLRNAPGNFKPEYILTEAIPVMDKAETAQKTSHYRRVRIDEATLRIDGNNANLTTELEKQQDVDTLVSEVQTWAGTNGVDYGLAEQKPGALITDAHDIVKNVALVTEGDDKVMDKLIEVFSKAQVEGHPAGKGTYATLYADKFSAEAIEQTFNTASITNNRNETQAQKTRVNNTIKDAEEQHTELLMSGAEPNGAEVKALEKGTWVRLAELGGATTEQITKLQTTFARKLMTKEASAAHIDSLAGRDGEVAEADIILSKKLLHPDAVEEARNHGQIVETPFLGTVEASTQFTTSGESLKKHAIKQSQKRYLNNPDAQLDKASELAYQILLKDGVTIGNQKTPGLAKLARNKYLQFTTPDNDGFIMDPTYTRAQAIKDAEVELISKFKKLQTELTEEGNVLYNFNGEGFKNIADRYEKHSTHARSLIKQVETSNWAINTVKKHGIDGLLKNSYIGLTESDWQVGILTGKRPGRVWDIITRVAVENGYTGTSWDLYNTRAEAEGRPILELPAEASLLKERLPANYIQKLVRNPGSTIVQNQALEAMEVPSKKVLKRLIVTTPRQIRPPHLGPQKQNTFISDVASVVSDAPREIPQPKEQPKGKWIGTGRSKKWVPDNQEGN